MDAWPVFLFGAMLLAFAAALIIGFILEQKKREAFTAFAAAEGWTYHPEKDPVAARSFAFLQLFDHGSNRYLSHRFRGQYAGRPFDLFEYHYQVTTGSGKNRRTTHHHFRAATSPLPMNFPKLVITPENVFDKIAAAFGFDDIDFESAEFSRLFKVKSPDRKFAYAVIHPLMMEWLLQRPQTTLEIDGSCLAVIDKGTLELSHIHALLGFMNGIQERLPAHLLQEKAS